MVAEKTIQHTLSQIGSLVSGTATVSGGIWTWANENAGVIGLLFTFCSLVTFIGFQYLSRELRTREVALAETNMQLHKREVALAEREEARTLAAQSAIREER